MGSTAGYSGTPLAQKLGIGSGCRVYTWQAPAPYRDWLAPLPDGVRFERRLSAATDVAHCFCVRQADLAEQLQAARAALRPDGVLWISWPKKAAKVATDISEDTIRRLCLPLGLVDVKVCAVSAVWSGLKLVLRKELRPPCA